MPTQFTAIDPNGLIHKRSSARAYTHTVVSQYNAERMIDSYNSSVYANIASQNFYYMAKILDGTSQWLTQQSWQTDEMHAERCAKLIDNANADLLKGETRDEYITRKVKAGIEHIEVLRASGYYDVFHNDGWCSRHDLAKGLASKIRNQGRLMVTVLDAVICKI